MSCISQIISSDPSLINEKDDEGYTPLHLAVISGNKAIVKYLISKGADFNAVDNENHSSVHWATGRNLISKFKEFLITLNYKQTLIN